MVFSRSRAWGLLSALALVKEGVFVFIDQTEWWYGLGTVHPEGFQELLIIHDKISLNRLLKNSFVFNP
ncbi:MAG: hypothetical protein QME75_15905 [Deltaproteobacteria bacterium]|nr:hypothetical protein [Deltaproteobacteria bacterium]